MRELETDRDGKKTQLQKKFCNFVWLINLRYKLKKSAKIFYLHDFYADFNERLTELVVFHTGIYGLQYRFNTK